MRKIYSFKKYESLTEGEMSDFVKKFSNNLGKSISKLKDSLDKQKDPTFEFKEKPLKRDDTRKEWVKKIQEVFVHKKLQEEIKSSSQGSFGQKTEDAVKKYQKEKGKKETGEVNDELMKLIIKDLEDIQKEKEKNK